MICVTYFWKNNIVNIKILIGYNWYHLPDDKKEISLENYLKQMGFVFNNEQVKEVLKRKTIKRKVGQRPVKPKRM